MRPHFILSKGLKSDLQINIKLGLRWRRREGTESFGLEFDTDARASVLPINDTRPPALEAESWSGTRPGQGLRGCAEGVGF